MILSLTRSNFICYNMEWSWCDILEYTLLPSIIVIHTVAFVFLKRTKYSKRYKNQIIIITFLCIFELAGAVLLISYGIFDYFVSSFVADIILCFIEIFIMLNYYFMMLLLTIDRFLVFYLNLRYQLYVSSSKILKLISLVTIVSFLASVIFAVLMSTHAITWSQFYSMLFLLCLIFDTGYICFFIGVYSFIYRTYRKRLMFREKVNTQSNKDHFKLFIPTLIVATYIIFNIIPNIINTNYRYETETSGKTVIQIAYIFYRIGWLVDPVIYIFFSSCIQNIKNILNKKYTTSKIRPMSLKRKQPSRENITTYEP